LNIILLITNICNHVALSRPEKSDPSLQERASQRS
jgi:hypothetical protein